MKVGTDGVLLGAWVPVDGVAAVLDVGTGTGLIALMVAQRQPNAIITAIDIDREACEEASSNFQASPWAGRLSVVHASLQEFARASHEKYDLIITNPPYFSRSLPAPCGRRTAARHDQSLNGQDLADCCKRLLKEDGHLALILPAEQYEKFCVTAIEYGLFETERMLVRAAPGKPVIRVLSRWGMRPAAHLKTEQMVIEEKGRHQYSDEYVALTGEFYLSNH